MNERIYRVRVEKRPREEYKRYYPEYADILTKVENVDSDNLSWFSLITFLSRDKHSDWYKTLQEAMRDIDKVVERTIDYTIDIIPYPLPLSQVESKAIENTYSRCKFDKGDIVYALPKTCERYEALDLGRGYVVQQGLLTGCRWAIMLEGMAFYISEDHFTLEYPKEA